MYVKYATKCVLGAHMKICIAIIYYDNAEEIRAYLQALANQSYCSSITVIMIVNKGLAADAYTLQQDAAIIGLDVFVAVPQANLGYLNGFLYGYAAYVKETGTTPDWAMLSNTDISFPHPDFFRQFMQDAYEPGIGIVGPSVLNPKFSEYQSPHRIIRRSKRSLQIRVLLFSIPFLRGMYVRLADSKYKRRRTIRPESGYVYEVNGAFLAFSKAFMAYFSQQHYGMLLYGEEVFIAEHALRAGVKTYFDASIEIIHNEHASTKQINAEKTAKLLRDNLRYNLREFY